MAAAKYLAEGARRIQNRIGRSLNLSSSNTEKIRMELEAARERVRELQNQLAVDTDAEADRAQVQILLRNALEQNHEGILILDSNFRYVYVNSAAVKQAKMQGMDYLGQTMMKCHLGIEKTGVFAMMAQTLNDRIPRSMDYLHEFADGTSCWFEIFVEPHRAGILVRTIDISKRKKVEEQYLHAQKLDAFGQLAGGMAHDFNNKLAVMQIYCESAMEMIPKSADPALRNCLDKVLLAVEQGTMLTKQLLAFGRKQVLDLRTYNLNELVLATGDGIRKLLGENIELKFFPDANLANVKVDKSQIDQVLLNMCINAKDAMPRGGTLIIETTNVMLDAEYCREHGNLLPGQYVMLSISDTGEGMPPEIRARVFEPFFTTKAPGKGTGLGLASVHGIVNQSSGHIWVYSEVGSGTVFKIFFPAVAGAKDTLGTPAEETKAIAGTERVLLVEDDSLLREAFGSALKNAGYKVTKVGSAEEAAEAFKRVKGDFDLLLTDVILPRKTGIELSKDLLQLKSDLKVVFLSGYTEHSMSRHAALDPDSILVQKPVSIRNFLLVVRQVLDGERTRGIV